MRKLSVRTKVTAWYTIFVIIIAFVAMFVLFRFSGSILWSETEGELRENVADFAEDLEVYEEGNEVRTGGPLYEDDIMFSVYDKDGKLLEGNVPSSFPESTVLKSGEVQKIENNSKQWMTYDVALDFGSGDPVWVRGVAYTGVVSRAERGLLIVLCVTLPVLVILAGAGGYIITRRAFAPVEHMRRTAHDIACSHDLSRRVPAEDTRGELHDLAQTFNQMLGSIERAFEDEKQFTADASHELRTPVSVIIAQGEYALLKDTEEQEKTEALSVILGQAQKMSQLIESLLALARSNQKMACIAGSAYEYGKIDSGLSASIAVEEMHKRAGEKKITISADISDGCYILADQDGLTRIFLNLIENSIQYGYNGGHIQVKVSADHESVICSVKDDGPGIAPECQQDIFRRFYRGDKARTSGEKSHAGLGLALVKALAESYGGTVSVKSGKEKGAEFIICFPAADGGSKSCNQPCHPV